MHNDGKGFPLGDPPFYGLPQDAGGGGVGAREEGRKKESVRVEDSAREQHDDSVR